MQVLTTSGTWFQSALAPKDERYHLVTVTSGIARVSIRSRPEGREIPAPVTFAVGAKVSIRSRPEGREIPNLAGPEPWKVNVSIRSRPEGREIRQAKPTLVIGVEFQSALAPKDERYGRPWNALNARCCFNPLSPRRTRDTQPSALCMILWQCFNPLSPRRTERNHAIAYLPPDDWNLGLVGRIAKSGVQIA